MRITILTLFPDLISSYFRFSVPLRAQQKGLVTVDTLDMRSVATDRYKSVDDRPYGGGTGMILRVDIVDRALRKAKQSRKAGETTRTILLDPQGAPFTQGKAVSLSSCDRLILICGHYEGVDDRIRRLVDEELSLGDFVLSGGEPAAIAVADSVIRLIPGVLRSSVTTEEESFSGDTALLEFPQFTKPRVYRRMRVPPVLLSGNHAAIAEWKARERRRVTRKKRNDLIGKTLPHS
ncbi:tRNA (guanosine(37)-N1)-methyltransferase TrmD [Patescibacteria group bacterium]|nr:tRNA (guanosine(37)-N1)-methyltransferase TrmD [Patescibacteria group bacterium]